MSRDLPRTILGRTSLEVTRFGIGGTYCETVDGYRAVLDCGVNYIDTARSYLGFVGARDGHARRAGRA